jgi:hypothetical protein
MTEDESVWSETANFGFAYCWGKYQKGDPTPTAIEATIALLSAYGWQNRYYRPISLDKEILQCIKEKTGLERRQLLSSLQKKATQIGREIRKIEKSLPQILGKDLETISLKSWNCVSQRFDLETALEALVVMTSPDGETFPLDWEKAVPVKIRESIKATDLAISEFCRKVRFPEWLDYVFTLKQRAGKSLFTGGSNWMSTLERAIGGVEIKLAGEDYLCLIRERLSLGDSF